MQQHTFLASKLDAGEPSASLHNRLTPLRRDAGARRIGRWVGSTVDQGVLKKFVTVSLEIGDGYVEKRLYEGHYALLFTLLHGTQCRMLLLLAAYLRGKSSG